MSDKLYLKRSDLVVIARNVRKDIGFSLSELYTRDP
jgi:hypothetical protein